MDQFSIGYLLHNPQDFELTDFFQGSGFYLNVEGGFNYTQGNGRHGGFLGNKYADDVFLWYNAGGESGSDLQWNP